MKKLCIFLQTSWFSLLFTAIFLLSCSLPGTEEEIVENRYTEYTIVIAPSENGYIKTSKTKAFAGERITITAFPDDTPAGEAEGALPWRVDLISCEYENEGDYHIFKATKKSSPENTYLFTMPPGAVMLSTEFTQEPPSDNTSIEGVYLEGFENLLTEDGVSKNYFTEKPFDYTGGNNYSVKVPHGYAGVRIRAQAEDGEATYNLTTDNPDDIGNEVPDENEGLHYRHIKLPVGHTKFTLKITSADKKHSENYILDVNQEPDLSLTSIYLQNSKDTIKENFKMLAEETVTVQYSKYPGPYTLSAYTEKDVTVTIALESAPATGTSNTKQVSNFSLGSETCTALITVSQTVNEELYEREYRIHVIVDGSPGGNGAGPVAHITSGGTATEDNGTRVHTFTSTNTFYAGEGISGVRILLVGGGGGGGGGYDDVPSSGGGAGGVVIHDNYTLSAGSYTVVVGSGGAGGSIALPGANGGDSEFGSYGVTAGFIAYGGGGGGAGTLTAGTQGGSWGGGSIVVSLQSPPRALGGTFTSGGTAYGNIGGTSSAGNDSAYHVGGGGGAGGPGVWGVWTLNTSGNGGGSGMNSTITGASKTYAAGGNIPSGSTSNGASGAQSTGNGGQGAWGQYSGGTGGSGIVIIRVPPKSP